MGTHGLFFLAGVVVPFHLAAQQPAWAWGRAVLGNSNDTFEHVTTDDAGNVYTSGELLSDTAWFDGLSVVRPVGATTASFLVMYNWLGTPQWGIAIQGLPLQLWRDQYGSVLGNSMFTGTFSTPDTTVLSSGNWSYQCSAISSAGSVSTLIVLLDLFPFGSTLEAPIALPDTSFGMTVVAVFGDSLLIGDTTHHAIEDAVVVARYTNAGDLEWSNHLVDGWCICGSLAVGAEIALDGRVGVFGVFSDVAQLGDSLASGGFTIQYMTSTTPTGGNGTTLLQSMGGNGSLVTFGWDNSDHPVVAADFGDSPAWYTYIASYDSVGQERWDFVNGPCSGMSPYGLDFDADGAAYLTGWGFNCATSCNGSTFGPPPSVFVQKLDTAGVCEWVVHQDYGFPGPPGSMHVHDPYTLYLVGSYSPVVVFGPDTLPNLSAGSYIAKLSTFSVGVSSTTNETEHSFPNPTTGLVQVPSCMGTLIVSDASGRQLLSLTCGNGPLDLSALASGLYFLTWNGQTQRLVKE